MTSSRRRKDRLGFLAGLLATTAGEVTAAATRRGRSPSSGLARGLVDASPAMVVDGAVALVGTADKPGLAVLAAATSGVAAAGGSAVAQRKPLVGAAVAAAPHVLGGALALRHRDASVRDTVTATAIAAAVSTVAVTPVRAGRLTAATVAAAASGAVVVADRRARRRGAAALRDRGRLPAPASPLPPLPADADSRPGMAPLLARPGEIPVIDITVPEPRVDLESWRLTVDGDVSAALTLSLSELLALPLVERDLIMVCVHNPVGGSRMGCARWTGIGLADLLARAGISDNAGWLVAESVDGYTNVLPVDVARRHGFLAVGMAGEPLPREHGSPARLLVSGRHGQDGNLKWLRRLTVTAAPPLSYWGRRGWSDGTYPVHPAARIDTPGRHARVEPGPIVAAGYAWAPPVGVDAVQLSVDGGSWNDATLGTDLGPDAWRPWSATWRATPGRHELRVRCRTSTGHWQEETVGTPYPHGVRGIHRVSVHVGGRGVARAARHLIAEAATRGGWAAASVAAWRQRA